MAHSRNEYFGSAAVVAGPLAAQIARFDERHWSKLQALACMSPRLGQLAKTHPFMFFALGVKYGALEDRELARKLAMAGRPLGEVCAAMGIPLSFRNLPPEACDRVPVPVRWSTAANRQLASLIPDDPVLAGDWLTGICLANAACDEKFALWLARNQQLFGDLRLGRNSLVALAVFAWYSQAEQVPAVKGFDTRWSAKLGVKKAFMRARTWGQYLGLVIEMGPEGLHDPWIADNEVDGYRFVPLTTPEDVLEEALAMRNCLISYGDSLARNHCRMFSVRRGKARVANLEVRYFRKREALEIVQIKGVQNTACPPQARAVAQRWINKHNAHVPGRAVSSPVYRKRRQDALLVPYLTAKQSVLRRIGPVDWSSVVKGLAELNPHHRVQMMLAERAQHVALRRRLRRAA